MEKTIGYSSDDLEKNLKFIMSQVNNLDSEITMVEEMGCKLRDNLDFASTGKKLRIHLEQIKCGISRFEIIKVPYQDLNPWNYEQYRLPIVMKGQPQDE